MNRLLADIGGTHTRLALDSPFRDLKNTTIFDNRDFPDLASLIESYLGDVDRDQLPVEAALAVACPVNSSNQVKLTNLDWEFSITDYRTRFNLEQLYVINDFSAIALAIPRLQDCDVMPIGTGTAIPDFPIAVLGPGTGLGVAGLVPIGEDWIPVATEGGHVTLAATTEREAAVIKQLRGQYGHVSAERVLSGPGLETLYRALAGLEGKNIDAPDAEVIIELAKTGQDPIAMETADLFFAMLGTVAGNLALTLGARGGIYLAGGILPQITDMLQASSFRKRFVEKGRYESYLETIPTCLITRDTPALMGLQVCMDKIHSSPSTGSL